MSQNFMIHKPFLSKDVRILADKLWEKLNGKLHTIVESL